MDTPITMSLLTLLKHCRRPLYYKTKINQLRNHETLSLGAIRQSNNRGGFDYGQAYIQKRTKGRYEFVGIWTLSSKSTRKWCWVQGGFTVNKGQVQFENDIDKQQLRAFFKVCRYLGVYKRDEERRLRIIIASHRRVNIQYPHDHGSYDYPLKNEEDSWFYEHDFKSLFCGEVISSGLGWQSEKFTLDIRDRIATDPVLVFLDKYQEAD